MVFFRSGACGLEDAERELAGHGLSVTRRGDQLVIRWARSPEFRVDLASGDSVRAEAGEIGEATGHAALRGCDARFEIGFDDLDEVQDEINTLIEIQARLQNLSRGFLFLPWNGAVDEPDPPG